MARMNMLGKPKSVRFYTSSSSNLTNQSTGGRNACKDIETQKINRKEMNKIVEIKRNECVGRLL